MRTVKTSTTTRGSEPQKALTLLKEAEEAGVSAPREEAEVGIPRAAEVIAPEVETVVETTVFTEAITGLSPSLIREGAGTKPVRTAETQDTKLLNASRPSVASATS
jgi:hypothetical protein